MEEQWERTYIPYSYTYDQFTVFFHSDNVYIGERHYPVGQCCVDILNTGEAVFDEIDRRAKDFVPAAWELLRVKTSNAVAQAQQRLNAFWDLVFALPVYRDLNMDHDCNYHALENLVADRKNGRWYRCRTRMATRFTKAWLLGLRALLTRSGPSGNSLCLWLSDTLKD